MAENWTIGGVSEPDRGPQTKAPPPPRSWAHALGVVACLVALAALASSAWLYASTQRDLVRVATEIAQLRLSLDLYAQRTPGAEPDPSLLDLANRLAILEQNWRDAPVAPTTLPASTSATPPAGTSGEDCLPTGTRFMVAAGDSYPVCGSVAVVSIGAVDDGFITLADGTVVAQGGNIAMPGTGCMLGVVPSDGGSLSGFAEIRVTC